MSIAAILALSMLPMMDRHEFTQMHMGVQVRLTLFSVERSTAERAARAGFRRFSELDAIMSDYQTNSELNRVAREASKGPVKISPDLARVMRQAYRVYQITDGAFDVTAKPQVDLWRAARRSAVLPEAQAMRAARALTNGSRARVTDGMLGPIPEGMRFDLGGIAKGDACDQVLAVMREEGVESAMVEAGGDIAVSGPPPGKEGWTIAISGVTEPVTLKYQAMSTSGDSEQFVEIAGVRYSHVLDPRTGVGVTNRRQVTVIAPNGLTSDPLATAGCIDLSSIQGVSGVRVITVEAT
jgi:FAD:protein FMN transferase